MHLQRKKESFFQEDLDWLPNWNVITPLNQMLTLKMTDFVKASHYPNWVIPSGTILGQYTSGVNDTFWGPWDLAASDGREDAKAIVYSGGQLPNQDGALIDAEILVAAVMWQAPAEIEVARMPTQLNNGAAHVPTQTEFAAAGTNWINLDDL